jgi:hypothetical protein
MEDTMWEWHAANWMTMLVAIGILACPLMHFFGHGHCIGHPRGHREGREHRS